MTSYTFLFVYSLFHSTLLFLIYINHITKWYAWEEALTMDGSYHCFTFMHSFFFFVSLSVFLFVSFPSLSLPLTLQYIRIVHKNVRSVYSILLRPIVVMHHCYFLMIIIETVFHFVVIDLEVRAHERILLGTLVAWEMDNFDKILRFSFLKYFLCMLGTFRYRGWL